MFDQPEAADMRLPEQRLWDTMRANKPPRLVLERVENIVSDGMPDVYVIASKVTTWVELKAPNPVKRANTRLLGDEGLRQSQKNWHMRHARLGLTSWVLIRERRTGRLWLVHGSYADEINDMTAADLDAVSEANSWPDVYKRITR